MPFRPNSHAGPKAEGDVRGGLELNSGGVLPELGPGPGAARTPGANPVGEAERQNSGEDTARTRTRGMASTVQTRPEGETGAGPVPPPPPGQAPGPDWAGGLPEDVLVKVAEALVAQNEAGWAAELKEEEEEPDYWTEERIQENMAMRKRDGIGLFVFARVCKGWRKAQLKVGGPLCTRVLSDVIQPGSVALAKWALAEG